MSRNTPNGASDVTILSWHEYILRSIIVGRAQPNRGTAQKDATWRRCFWERSHSCIINSSGGRRKTAGGSLSGRQLGAAGALLRPASAGGLLHDAAAA